MTLDRVLLIGRFVVAVISFVATEVLPFIASL
jgi:hypothetical protein